MKPENVKCPECDGPMVSRKSQYGVFWGCVDYPKCRGTRNADGEARRAGAPRDGSEDTFAPSERQHANDRRRWEHS